MLLRAHGISARARLLPALALLLLLSAGRGQAADLCGSDSAPREGEQKLALADGGCFRLSQGRPACLDNCMTQCRQAERSCSGDRSACRTQFQICARRCVVSCGGR